MRSLTPEYEVTKALLNKDASDRIDSAFSFTFAHASVFSRSMSDIELQTLVAEFDGDRVQSGFEAGVLSACCAPSARVTSRL